LSNCDAAVQPIGTKFTEYVGSL